MSIVLPTDGHAIYDDISPGQGQSVYGPRLQQIAAGGFRVVINYALLYDSTANMIAYINYAASVGLRVGIAMDLVCSPPGGSLATAFPTIYTEAGSPGTTNFNAFGTYVVNQVKSLPGTWGYYIADEPSDSNHATIKSFHDAIVAADNTRPILIICDSDTTTSGISNFWAKHTVTWADCCTVGGDDFYPIGLTNGSVSGYTIGIAADAIQRWTSGVYGQDNFARSNQSGLGIASDGQSWKQYPSSGTVTASISSNAATFSGNGSETDGVFTLGAISTLDLDLQIDFNQDGDPSNDVGLFWHGDGTTQNTYRLIMDHANLILQKYVGGTRTTITSIATGIANASTTTVTFHVQMTGTTINARAWVTGQTEPSSWLISTTDSTFASGNFGIWAWVNSGTATVSRFAASTMGSAVNSAIVLQAFDFNNSVTPSFDDMVAMCGQALAHMQPRLLLWFSYENIWGCPANIHDSAIPADPSASTLWANLCRAIGSVPSRWIEEIEQDNPLHLWRCDDPLCFAFGDDLFSINATTISGTVTRQQAALIPTDLDPSCSFNGTNSAITLTTTGFPSGSQPWTLGGILQYASLPGAGVYQFIAGIGTFASAQSANIGYNGDSQNLTLDLHGIADVDTGVIPTLNTPYLLIATYDGTVTRVYVNGVLKASRTNTLNITYGAAYIGRGTGGNNFGGLIKDVFLLNTALSVTRIAAYANAMNGIAPHVPSQGDGHGLRTN